MGNEEEDKDKILVNIGLCHLRTQNYLEAIAAYQKALRINPSNAKANYRMMKEYQELQKSSPEIDYSYQLVVNAANYV